MLSMKRLLDNIVGAGRRLTVRALPAALAVIAGISLLSRDATAKEPSRRSHLERLHQEGLARLTNEDPADDSDGVAMLMQAAAGGLPSAQYDLAVAYERGNGVGQSYAKEVEWLKRASERGMVEAEFKLANCYRTGKGTAVDLVTAFAWYRRAAEAGDAEAQDSLGAAHLRGDGVERSVSEAVRWYERALATGYLLAGKSLVVIALREAPGAPDYVTAEKWLILLGARSHDLPTALRTEVEAARTEIERHLSPAQMGAAGALAHDWSRAHGSNPTWRPSRVRSTTP
jgi:TPR repeat protein